MLQRLALAASHPLTRRLYWVLYAILFYNSGLAFTIWLLQPEQFAGGWEWAWLALFPLLLPGFFIVNRYLGCASGQCSDGQCSTNASNDSDNKPYGGRMPGM